MNPTDYPILAQLLTMVREETGIDATLDLEGGKFYVHAGPTTCGPMDHSQAWYYLFGMMVPVQTPATLDTEKRRHEQKLRDKIREAATQPKAAE